jgi:hypothetical protein
LSHFITPIHLFGSGLDCFNKNRLRNYKQQIQSNFCICNLRFKLISHLIFWKIKRNHIYRKSLSQHKFFFFFKKNWTLHSIKNLTVIDFSWPDLASVEHLSYHEIYYNFLSIKQKYFEYKFYFLNGKAPPLYS